MDAFDLPLTLLTATALPIALGTLVGFPFWRKRRVILGNVLASVAVAIVILFLIARAFGLFFACSSAQEPDCISQSGLDFGARVLIGLAVVGWLDVFVLLLIGGMIEDRARKGMLRVEDL